MNTWRKAGLAGAVAALLCAPAFGAAAQAILAPAASGPGSLNGMWLNDAKAPRPANQPARRGNDPRPQIFMNDDGPVPLQPWADKIRNERYQQALGGKPWPSLKSRCLPAGVPITMFQKQPIQILETPNQVTILEEEFNYFRVIRLNAEHLKDPDPALNGESVGHWEGDTLVVDTIGVSDKTTFDATGTPHSDQLHIVERYRRVPDGLEMVATFDDPKAFTHPFQVKTHYGVYAEEPKIMEYYCDDNRNPVIDGGTSVKLSASH